MSRTRIRGLLRVAFPSLRPPKPRGMRRTAQSAVHNYPDPATDDLAVRIASTSCSDLDAERSRQATLIRSRSRPAVRGQASEQADVAEALVLARRLVSGAR
jgi:hypothetical protein